ncbi:hypothetical protein LPTSP2_37520 [Leptospira ellinghausenii]|uniref:Uncharacterized protein n=1 Tax=Leptospira ellinghausenii TaxID=1917822 RepID=A0A2P2DIL8_9LEPT|nr:hypothetical protein LPTSP2_37520 [Leptospira ellinghausenii]
MSSQFSYSGKNISVSLHWSNNNLSFSVFKINPEYENGDLFFSDKFLVDQDGKFLNYLCLPLEAIKATPKKPATYQIGNIDYNIFEAICRIIREFDQLSIEFEIKDL